MLQNLARGLVAAMLAAAAFAHAASPAPLKVGFVYVTPVLEAGWTHQHDEGRRAMEKALGNQVETTVV